MFSLKQVTNMNYTHTHLGSQLFIDQPKDNRAFENIVTKKEKEVSRVELMCASLFQPLNFYTCYFCCLKCSTSEVPKLSQFTEHSSVLVIISPSTSRLKEEP